MKAIIPTLLITLLVGCAHEGARPPLATRQFDLENTSEYALMGPRVQRSVTFSSTQKRILEDGRLEVITNMRNRENRRIEVQASCIFKDENNFSTGDETPWQTVILTENSQEAIKFTAMNPKAKNFTIRVREAH